MLIGLPKYIPQQWLCKLYSITQYSVYTYIVDVVKIYEFGGFEPFQTLRLHSQVWTGFKASKPVYIYNQEPMGSWYNLYSKEIAFESSWYDSFMIQEVVSYIT